MEVKVANKPIQDEQEKLFADLDKLSLHALSYALRHPDTWPEGFVWNYHRCESCAMGLAHQLWKSKVPITCPDNGASRMAHTFAMPYEAAKSIFLGMEGSEAADWMPGEAITQTKNTGHLWWKKSSTTTHYFSDHVAVSPEMVADQIDAYLATAE